jgi:hypothetical protein
MLLQIKSHRSNFIPPYSNKRSKLFPATKLVAICVMFGDVYHTWSAARNAAASVQHAVVVRQAQVGSHPGLFGTCRR